MSYARDDTASMSSTGFVDPEMTLPQWRLLLCFSSADDESGYRQFAFPGRVSSGIVAFLTCMVYVFALGNYARYGVPDLVLGLNIAGMLVCLPVAITMICVAWCRARTEASAIPSAGTLGGSPLRPPVTPLAAKPSGWLDSRAVALVEEGGLAFVFGVVMIVQAATMWPKYAGCVDKYGARGCVDYVDLYLIAPLEAFAVISPARFIIVWPLCAVALLVFGLSRLWTDIDEIDSITHVTRFAVEFAVATVNLISCWWREAGLRAAYDAQRQAQAADREMHELDKGVLDLNQSMLPRKHLDRLRESGGDIVQQLVDSSHECSVFRSDLVGFTAWSSRLPPGEVVELLSSMTNDLDTLAVDCNVEKVKTIGDAYWAVCGLPDEAVGANAAVHIVRFALRARDKMREAMDQFSRTAGAQGHRRSAPSGVRIGVGTGSAFGTLVGQAQLSYEVFGEADDIAAMLEERGVPFEVVVCPKTIEALARAHEVDRLVILTAPVVSIAVDDSRFDFKHPHIVEAHNADADRVAELVRLFGRFEPASGPGTAAHTAGGSPPEDAEAFSLNSVDVNEAILRALASPMSSVQRHESKPGTPRDESTPSLRRSRAPSKFGQLNLSRQSSERPTPRDSHQKRVVAGFTQMSAADGFQAKQERLRRLDAAFRDDLDLKAVLWNDFENPELEARYASYGRRVERLPFRACSVALVICLLGLGLQQLGTGDLRDGPLGNWAIAMLGLACGLSAMFPFVLFINPPREEFQVRALLYVYYASGAIGIVAAGLSGPSFVTNNVFYLRMAFAVLKGSVVSVSAIYGAIHDMFPTVAAGITLYVGARYEDERGVDLLVEYSIWLVASYFVGIVCRVANQAQNARMFIADEQLHVLAGEKARRVRNGVAVVGRVVPEFMASSVLTWYVAGLAKFDEMLSTDTQDAVARVNVSRGMGQQYIVREYQSALIMFVHLAAKTSLASRRTRDHMASGTHSVSSVKALAALLDQVDAVIGSQEEAGRVVKIKAVGDTLLLAGFPREGASDEERPELEPETVDAAVALATLLLQLNGVNQRCKAGIHVGPLVGCVLGRQRLSFDVLGDTVNTASRLMSTGDDGEISLSRESWEMLRNAPRNRADDFARVQRSMKGKGVVDVYAMPAVV